jgi:DNA-binding transcriptional LysR family regulator
MPQPSRSQIVDQLGLVAGMFEELGMGTVIDQATQPNPTTRMVTVGNAVKAMVLNGLGFVIQQLSLVPLFFQHKPTHRLIAPGIEPSISMTRRWGALWRPSMTMASQHSTVSWRSPPPIAWG